MPKQGTTGQALQKLHARAGRRVLNAYHSFGDLQVIQLAPGEKLEEAALHYMSSGLVEFVEPDYKLHAAAVPNDPEFTGGTQWSLRNSSTPGHDINAVPGWDTLSSASNIVVAVVDSGIRYTHDDLAANVWTNPNEIPDNGIDDDGNGIVDDVHGINAIDSSGEVLDDAGHGTHVSGIIGAVGNNGIGISGVAWNVKLMACKFLDNTGDGDTSDAIRCVDYARRNGANVINASWGGSDYSAALYTAISNCRAAGIIIVTAAGNDSVNIDTAPLYPACYNLDNIVVVGGTTRSDTLDSSYSNYGPLNVDLCAPGTGIYSTWNSWDGAYSYLSGTSMAAPHVTGVLALMKARFPAMTYSQLVTRLYATVDVLPSLAGKCKTGGRVNLGRALGSDPAANFSASKTTGEPPLTVNFTNLSQGTLKSVFWDFGDGTPAVTNNDPIHVFAAIGNFDVRLTVVGTNNRTNTFDLTVKVMPKYQFGPEQYSWIDPTSLAAITLADNGVSDVQRLPFGFKFYGQNYGSIYIGANGILGFNRTDLDTTLNTSLPTSGTPNGIICPYWDNLNPAAGGNIYAGYVGDAPMRRYVVSWVNVPRNSTPVNLTFQAVLEEGSNEIVFQYLEVQPATTRGGAKRASVGVEDATGTVATQYTYNGVPTVLSNQSALRAKLHDYRYLVARNSPIRLRAVYGFPLTNVTDALRIANPGTLGLDWTLTSSDAWLGLPSSGGTLAAGEEISVPIGLSATAQTLALGTHTGSLTLKNTTDGAGDSVIPVELLVELPKSVLVFGDSSGSGFSGGFGGPFSPSTVTTDLRNSGNIPLNWSGSVSVPWLSIRPDSGTLAPGGVQSVQITLTTAAESLTSGISTGLVRFENQTDSAIPLEEPIQVEVRSKVEQTSAAIANGVFSGTVTVPQGNAYQVEYSDDLQTWLPLDTVPEISGTTLKFDDPDSFENQRFYRVRVD